ncbi:Hypothetical predicted protein, partial [Marmota monax]
NYFLSKQDTRKATKEIVEHDFIVLKNLLKMLDVGGQRSQHRNTKNIRFVFHAVKDTILQENLKDIMLQ